MVRLLHVLEMLVGFVGKKPWLSAFVLCAVCAVVSRVAVPPFLHNDDCQIQFLLADGGMFSFYTNVCLASVLGWFSDAVPSVSWYLVLLVGAGFAAFWCVTGCALEGAFARRHDGGRFFLWSRLMVLIFCAYYAFECLSYIQYTQIGIFCVLGAVWLLFSAVEGSRGVFGRRVLYAFGLWMVGVCLRWDVSWVGWFFCAGFAGALWLKRASRAAQVRFWAVAVVCVLACLGLKWVQEEAYAGCPEWEEAVRLQWDRVAVQDYPDCSGKDKSDAYAALGIRGVELEAFKSFVYVPRMDDAVLMSKVREVHQSGSAGLWGGEQLGRLGFPPFDGSRILRMVDSGEKVAFWVPLGCLSLLLVFCSSRRGVWPLVPVLGGFAGYVAVLVFLDRCVPRVLNPAVAVAGLAVMAWMPACACAAGRRRWVQVAAGFACAGCVVFLCRNYGWVFRKAFSGQERVPAFVFCQSHPDELFLLLCQPGGTGLLPEGVAGFSREFLKSTNMFPVGDGWMFYSPVYRAELQRRGLDHPFAALVRDDVWLVAQDEEGGLPRFVLKLAEDACGCRLEAVRMQSVGGFAFWKFRRAAAF